MGVTVFDYDGHNVLTTFDEVRTWNKTVATFEFDPARYVAEAARLLDERKTDWFHHVDVDAIVMNSLGRCVLGQVYGAYHQGVTALFGIDVRTILTDPRVCAFGDASPVSAWVSEIFARRANAANAVSAHEQVSV